MTPQPSSQDDPNATASGLEEFPKPVESGEPRKFVCNVNVEDASVLANLIAAGVLIVGLAANSMMLAAEAARLLADWLEFRRFRARATLTERKWELLAYSLAVVVLLAGAIMFIFVAGQRLVFSSNLPTDPVGGWLVLIGALFAQASNFFLLYLHFATDWDMWQPREIGVAQLPRAMHGLGNHGVSVLIFLFAVVLFIEPSWLAFDSIGAWLSSLLLLANLSAVAQKTHKEYGRWRQNQGYYEVLL